MMGNGQAKLGFEFPKCVFEGFNGCWLDHPVHAGLEFCFARAFLAFSGPPLEGVAAERRLALMLGLARPEGVSSGAADTISSVNSFLGEKRSVANLPRCGPVCPV